MALEGRVTQHHRWLLTLLRNQLEFLEKQIADLDLRIQDCMCQYQKAIGTPFYESFAVQMSGTRICEQLRHFGLLNQLLNKRTPSRSSSASASDWIYIRLADSQHSPVPISSKKWTGSPVRLRTSDPVVNSKTPALRAGQ